MCENENNETHKRNQKGRKASKWTFFQHNGPAFPPPYEPLDERIPFKYEDTKIKLSPEAEEAATFYSGITKKELLEDDTFNNNFFTDWRNKMTEDEKLIITDLRKCNFRHLRNNLKQKRKFENASEHKKKKIKEKNARLKEQYGFCNIDGVKHEIANYKIDNGIFIGRGQHPKIGRIKRRIQPEDIIINCSEDSRIPEAPEGHTWKKIVHDNTTTWLAKWKDDFQNKDKYMKLKPSSKLKIEEDQIKYEKAKELKLKIVEIRKQYCEDFCFEEIAVRQRAVALYFIDHFGFRTGNEKNQDEEADTVGCCSLRVEHVKLQQEGRVVVFDFLGKSSVRYYNETPVEEEVFTNLQLFQENKSPTDKLFDCLTPHDLNQYLNKQMEGLTAKVFRIYNASYIFEKFLYLFTDPENYMDEKIRFYQCANFLIAILLNHRTTCERQFLEKKEQIVKVKKDIHGIVTEMKRGRCFRKEDSKIRRLLHDLKELRFKNKEILPGTSKFNYLDPRISVAWCQKFGVPVKRIYTLSEERKKFDWAIGTQNKDYSFCGSGCTSEEESGEECCEESGVAVFVN